MDKEIIQKKCFPHTRHFGSGKEGPRSACSRGRNWEGAYLLKETLLEFKPKSRKCFS